MWADQASGSAGKENPNWDFTMFLLHIFINVGLSRIWTDRAVRGSLLLQSFWTWSGNSEAPFHKRKGAVHDNEQWVSAQLLLDDDSKALKA